MYNNKPGNRLHSWI